MMKSITQLLTLICLGGLMSCAVTDAYNPWGTPNRYVYLPESEQAGFNASMERCIARGRQTWGAALARFEGGLPPGSNFYAIVANDRDGTSYVEVKSSDQASIRGIIEDGSRIGGRDYAGGDSIVVAHVDIIDWYILHPDRPPEGNLLGRYILLRQDGLAQSCDPDDVEFRRFRLFSMGYSFVPPDPEGWELGEPMEDYDFGMQQKDEDLNEVNTLSSARYRIEPGSSEHELIDMARSFGRYGDEEGERYDVVRLEADSFAHAQARCARSDHTVEDKRALLSKWGKRGPMMRDVQVLVCEHPTENQMGVVLIYSHRFRPGKRDPNFAEMAERVFDSVAFTTRYYKP